MSEVNVTIQDMTKREGTAKSGKPYTLVSITDDKGEKYSTFAGKWNQDWKPGDTVRAVLEVNGQYNNLKCPDDLKPTRGGGNARADEILGLLGSLDTKVNKVIDMLADLRLNNGGEDLPF